jgi:hypothetical protein
MEAESSSETLVPEYETTQRHIPDESNLPTTDDYYTNEGASSVFVIKIV